MTNESSVVRQNPGRIGRAFVVEPGSEQSRPFFRSDTNKEEGFQAIYVWKTTFGLENIQLTEGFGAVETHARVFESHRSIAE